MKSYFTYLHYKNTKSLLTLLLWPLSLIYGVIVTIRRKAYKKKYLETISNDLLVIVVGNITMGGTGKTPLVLYLIELLKQVGLKPGVVSRGYGGHAKSYPYLLTDNSTAKDAGDEPLLIYQRSNVPVVVDPNRPQAAKYLSEHTDCNVIISDDGLQHYRLERDIEIAVVDGIRLFGNGLLFPAGPLREKASRLKEVDFVIYNELCNDDVVSDAYTMSLLPESFINVKTKRKVEKSFFQNKNNVAIAGIGHPERFFKSLDAMNIKCLKQAMPDHYAYEAADFKFEDELQILMTEKDAVKVKAFATDNMWYIPVNTSLPEDFKIKFLETVTQTERAKNLKPSTNMLKS